MLTQLQQQTAQSLSRMRPKGKTLFEDLDFAVWTSCVRQMATILGVGVGDVDDLKEFRRLTRVETQN